MKKELNEQLTPQIIDYLKSQERLAWEVAKCVEDLLGKEYANDAYTRWAVWQGILWDFGISDLIK